jgi:cysteine desulfurase / selenocysteine lyase
VSVETLDIEAIRKDQFPITRAGTYLNHATYGPLPRCHVEAANQFNHDLAERMMGDFLDQWIDKVDEVRDKAAQLMNCEREDIAMLKNTTEGLCLVSQGLDWQPGDEVITYELEFPSDVYPWMNLRDKNVVVRFVKDRGYRFDASDVAELITPRTKVVCLSLVNFAHGFRAPIEEIGRLCQEKGIWLVVDAIQALGAMRVDVQALGADIVSAHGYKFLLSGWGLSVCYCSPRTRRELRVPQPGWKSIERAADINSMMNYNLDFPSSARRFESGVQSLSAVHGMGATLDLLLSIGPDVIEERVLQISTSVSDGLQAKGFQVTSSQRPGERSGILSAMRNGVDTAAIQHALNRNKVSCAMREGRIRVSPHFYNSAEDVQRLLSCLPR